MQIDCEACAPNDTRPAEFEMIHRGKREFLCADCTEATVMELIQGNEMVCFHSERDTKRNLTKVETF